MGMKIFGHTFIFPVLVRIQKDCSICGKSNWSFEIRYFKTKMDGSMKTTTHYFQFKINGRDIQFYFCWRPDVTRYWWTKKS